MANLNNIATGTSKTTTADKNLASSAISKSDVGAFTRSLFMRDEVMSANETAVDSLVKALIGLQLSPDEAKSFANAIAQAGTDGAISTDEAKNIGNLIQSANKQAAQNVPSGHSAPFINVPGRTVQTTAETETSTGTNTTTGTNTFPGATSSEKLDELTTFFKKFGPDVYSIVSAKTVDDLKEWARKMGSSDGVTTDNEAALLKKLDEIGRTLSPAGQALNMHSLKTMVADTFLGQAALNKMGESVNLPGVPADMQKMKTSDAEVTSSELDKMDVFIANMHRDKAIGESAIKDMSLGAGGLIGWAKDLVEKRKLAEQGFKLDYNGKKVLDRNGVPQKYSGDELIVLRNALETEKNLIWGHMPPQLKNYLLFNHTDTPAEIQKFKEVYGIK